MGDRGNIVVIQSGTKRDEQIWLYSHWGGTELPQNLKDALASAPGRWRDDTYLARIILMAMIPADRHDSETGWGISTRITDNEHQILVADVPNQEVWLIAEAQLEGGRVPETFQPKKRWKFEEFSKLRELPEI